MIRIAKVCELFSISKPTVYDWIEKGMPVYYIGKIPFFEEREIVDWIKRNGSSPKKRGE